MQLSADIGDEDFLDIYELGPLDPDLEFENVAEKIVATSFREAIATVERSFPNVLSRIVNEGVGQDEYTDSLARGREMKLELWLLTQASPNLSAKRDRLAACSLQTAPYLQR